MLTITCLICRCLPQHITISTTTTSTSPGRCCVVGWWTCWTRYPFLLFLFVFPIINNCLLAWLILQAHLLFFLSFLYSLCLLSVQSTAPAYFQLQKPFKYQKVQLFNDMLAFFQLFQLYKLLRFFCFFFVQCKSMGRRHCWIGPLFTTFRQWWC